MKKPLKSFNLEAIIGTVSKTYNRPEQFDNKLNIKKQLSNDEFQTYEVNGLKIRTRFKKVGESFKIKPHLKSIVEDVVKEVHSYGHNVSKGEIYNLLIETGLKGIKK